MDESTNRESKLTNHVAIWISLGAFVILVVHLFCLKIDTVGLSLVVLAVLPWLITVLADYVKKLKLPGGVEVELWDKIKKQDEKIQNQDQEIQNQKEISQLIYKALKGILTEYEFKHLCELASDNENISCKYEKVLEDEMIRLYQHQFVGETFSGSTQEMKNATGEFNLRKFYWIKEEGKNYLKSLERLKELMK